MNRSKMKWTKLDRIEQMWTKWTESPEVDLIRPK